MRIYMDEDCMVIDGQKENSLVLQFGGNCIQTNGEKIVFKDWRFECVKPGFMSRAKLAYEIALMIMTRKTSDCTSIKINNHDLLLPIYFEATPDPQK